MVADRLNKLRTDIEDTYQAITEIGGTIPSNKNTNNIPEAIRSVYDNLPKVTDTGTNVSLSPTLKGRLGIVPKGNTLQDGEPTPETPVEIQSATGTQKVVVSGKNLFDKNNVVSVDNKILNDSGSEVSDSGGGYTKMYIPVKPNTQYTISGFPGSGTKRIYYFDNLKTFISRTSGFGTTYTTITTPSNCYYLDIQYTTSGNDFNTYLVCKGISTEYQPYQEPQEVDIELSSRNLFDKDGSTLISRTYSKNTRWGYKLPEISNNFYVKKAIDDGIGFILVEDINGVLSNQKTVSTSGTLVTNNGNDFYILCVSTSNQQTANSYYNANNFMVSYENIDYTPYYNYTPNEIGDYEDYIGGTPDNWVLYKNIGKIDSYNGEIITTQYLSTTGGLDTGATVIYQLSSEQTETITDTNLISQLNELYYLMSYNDTTNIDVTGNLPMRITASAIKGA